MGKIIFDVTHLYGWKGGLTGIPRTTDEIARRLRFQKNSSFVSWQVEKKCFVNIDIEDYYENIDPVNRAYDEKAPSLDVDTSAFFHLKKVILRTPILGRSAKKINSELKKQFDRYKNTSLGFAKATPAAGDLLFIPCGVWDDKKYIESLLEYKARGVKLAFISYDMLPIVVPQFSGQWGKPMEDFTKKVTSICDVVFSISEYTKKDLINWLKKVNAKVPPIEVIRLGDIYKLSPPTMPKVKKLSKGEEFILCVGTVESRKNHTLLYYVYKLAKSRGIELPKLVIAGRPGHRTENIIEIIKDDPDVNEKITMLFNVNDNELSWLYKNCKFTVYPSFYEGWGLPIAESVANGIPCICSNTSSMTEVAPAFVEYFNPNSADECLKAIIKYMDADTYKKAVKKASTYKPISWDYTYEQIEASLNKIGVMNNG